MHTRPLASSLRAHQPMPSNPNVIVTDFHDWLAARAHPAQEELSSLIAMAATLDLEDAEAVVGLREASHRLTSRLARSGRLSEHLIVSLDDPGVVVVRSLAAAGRAVLPTPSSKPRR